MTISVDTSKQQYNGDDLQVIFPYEFKIFDESEIYVELRQDDGTIVSQVLNTDFTTSNASGVGGNVVMIVPPATDETLTVYRLVDLLQETDYVENDPFKAETHEDALDKLTMQNQQQNITLDRSIKIPITDSSTLNTELPDWETRAGKYLGFDGNGGLIATAGTEASSPFTPYIETLIDDVDAEEARGTLGSGTFGSEWFTYDTASEGIAALNLDFMENVVEDTTPQLGGDLELNGHNIDLGPILTVDATYKGKIMTVVVDDASAEFGKLLYCAADFHYELSDPTDASPYKMPVRCMALESGTGSKKVLLEGQVCKTSWNWSAGDLFATTSGDMTLTTPALSGDKVQKVGWTLSADTIYFKPDSTTVEKA
ncbi:MAG: hypothetical protein ACTSQ0_03015 [Candidatus Heimdallarchaeota archaeon]